MLHEILTRVAQNLHDRIGGPMTFRLVVQPLVAAGLAARDGLADARAGRPAYLWALLTDREHRRMLAREGWKAVLRVFLAAAAIDAVYQWRELSFLYPGEALIVASVLAVIPYIAVRGPVNRAARLLRRRSTP